MGEGNPKDMPIIKSAKKQMRINERNRARNLGYLTRMRNVLKSTKAAILDEAVTYDDARESLRQSQKVIYMTASKGIIHKKTASRRFGRLVKLFRKARVEGLRSELAEEAEGESIAAPAAPEEVKKVEDEAPEADTDSDAPTEGEPKGE